MGFAKGSTHPACYRAHPEYARRQKTDPRRRNTVLPVRNGIKAQWGVVPYFARRFRVLYMFFTLG